MSHSQRISWSCKIWGEIIPPGGYLGEWLCICTPDDGVTCSRSPDKINHGNFLHFPSLAQQTPMHTTSRHPFLKELPCQRRPSLLGLWEGLSDDLCKCLDDCKGKWGTPTLMTDSRKELLFLKDTSYPRRMLFSLVRYLPIHPHPPHTYFTGFQWQLGPLGKTWVSVASSPAQERLQKRVGFLSPQRSSLSLLAPGPFLPHVRPPPPAVHLGA